MIVNNNKTSLLVTQQLPEFVRDNPDYANFSLFLKAYYEWMEQTGQVTEELILYVFLGIFILFVLDSCVKTGKYSR